MRKKNFCFLLTIFCFLFLSNYSKAQTEQSSSDASDPQKVFLIDYLKSFNDFINNPDKYGENSAQILLKFKNPTSKKVFNFLSNKKNTKGNISPDSLVKHIKAFYPDGFGMAYSNENIQPVGKQNKIFSRTTIYKVPVEYSGIRNDGSLLSYNDEQYFYIKSKKGKNNSTLFAQVTEKSYFERKFKKKVFRQGLFVEPFIILRTEGKANLKSSAGDVPMTGYWSPSLFGSYKSLGLNIVYMIKPFIGFGAGISQFRGDHQYGIQFGQEYYKYSNYEVFGYKQNFQTINGDLKHKVKMTSSIAVPVFARLQIGWKAISVSADIGFKFIKKPIYESYLTGTVKYNGALYDAATSQVTFNNDPALGFGNYTYNNSLVHQYQDDKTLKMFFLRFNLNVQPSQYYNIRLSFVTNKFKEYNYNESWHMFDPYATHLRYVEINKNKYLDIWEIELGIGFNINNIFFK